MLFPDLPELGAHAPLVVHSDTAAATASAATASTVTAATGSTAATVSTAAANDTNSIESRLFSNTYVHDSSLLKQRR